MLEERRGFNFEYWNEKHDKMLDNGWDLYVFENSKLDKLTTSSRQYAKEIVEKLRSEGNFARIICGYEKNIQRIRMYSIIFKPKKK